ncbi:protein diaphanous homolog 1-like, partial [Amphiprion ocellaris]|uniref:protein diaphanous homolog 1-like n=1 Tax=Amphiprion ocellaris TaxID=80972 RepID=UPI0024112D8F
LNNGAAPLRFSPLQPPPSPGDTGRLLPPHPAGETPPPGSSPPQPRPGAPGARRSVSEPRSPAVSRCSPTWLIRSATPIPRSPPGAGRPGRSATITFYRVPLPGLRLPGTRAGVRSPAVAPPPPPQHGCPVTRPQRTSAPLHGSASIVAGRLAPTAGPTSLPAPVPSVTYRYRGGQVAAAGGAVRGRAYI